ncbi:MAG: hypothetical protein AAGL23_01235 [Pseudomonadota bacterium]
MAPPRAFRPVLVACGPRATSTVSTSHVLVCVMFDASPDGIGTSSTSTGIRG